MKRIRLLVMRVSIRNLLPLLCALLLLFSPIFAWQALKPSRDNFFREVLYPKATSVTPLYDDYTKGSYHVDKLDVFKGLPEMAQKEGLKLRGLIVIGPGGPLWTYYVVAFLDEGETIRVNLLTMPHARITYKSTGTITVKRYDEVLSGLLKTNVLATELPPKGKCDACPYPERHYEVLLADWSNGKSSLYYGRLIEPNAGANTDSFEKLINDLLSTSKKTYPLDRPGKSETSRAKAMQPTSNSFKFNRETRAMPRLVRAAEQIRLAADSVIACFSRNLFFQLNAASARRSGMPAFDGFHSSEENMAIEPAHASVLQQYWDCGNNA